MHINEGRNLFVGVYLGTKRSYPCEIESFLQSDEETAHLFFYGGTHRSTVFLFDQKNWEHEPGFHGNDPYHAAIFLSRHVREGRHAAGGAGTALY